MQTTGVDFDKRCKKWRARLTRDGVVYLIKNCDTIEEACRARASALKAYNNKKPFKYLHRYSTSNKREQLDGDDYLFNIGLTSEPLCSSPHRSLVVAILVQGIKDRLSNDPETREEARLWFESDDSLTLRFSFQDVCEELSINPKNVNKVIRKSAKANKPSKSLVGRRLVRSGRHKDNS